MEDGYNSKQTHTDTSSVNGVTTKVTETVLKKEDGTTKTITETTVTKPDGSRSSSMNTRTELPSANPNKHGAEKSIRHSSNQGQPSTHQPKKEIKMVSPGDLHPFREDALKAHNKLRAKHGAPELKLVKDLNEYAQSWAEHLVKTNTLAHSDCKHSTGKLGENIAMDYKSGHGGGDFTGEEATQAWYQEIKMHDFRKENQPGTGHFTQVVWVGTREMGIGKSKDAGGRCVVSASYRPAGNTIGTYANNVLMPKK